jgi:hypothetical protein
LSLLLVLFLILFLVLLLVLFLILLLALIIIVRLFAIIIVVRLFAIIIVVRLPALILLLIAVLILITVLLLVAVLLPVAILILITFLIAVPILVAVLIAVLILIAVSLARPRLILGTLSTALRLARGCSRRNHVFRHAVPVLITHAEGLWIAQAGRRFLLCSLADAQGVFQLHLVLRLLLFLCPCPQLLERLCLRLCALDDPLQQAGHLLVRSPGRPVHRPKDMTLQPCHDRLRYRCPSFCQRLDLYHSFVGKLQRQFHLPRWSRGQGYPQVLAGQLHRVEEVTREAVAGCPDDASTDGRCADRYGQDRTDQSSCK